METSQRRGTDLREGRRLIESEEREAGGSSFGVPRCLFALIPEASGVRKKVSCTQLYTTRCVPVCNRFGHLVSGVPPLLFNMERRRRETAQCCCLVSRVCLCPKETGWDGACAVCLRHAFSGSSLLEPFLVVVSKSSSSRCNLPRSSSVVLDYNARCGV